MHTMAEDKIDNALEVKEETVECKSEDWVCHSQAIAATMSNRMEELGMTQRENELHPAICIQGVERSRESVIGNFVQNRKCIRYQNTTSWNK